MMNEKRKTKIGLSIIFIMALLVLPHSYFNEKRLNQIKCEAKAAEIKGVVERVGLNPNFPSINVAGHVYTVTIRRVKKDWVSKYQPYYAVGDSIIKEPNSNEIIVKRDSDYAIYELDCKKWSFLTGLKSVFFLLE